MKFTREMGRDLDNPGHTLHEMQWALVSTWSRRLKVG